MLCGYWSPFIVHFLVNSLRLSGNKFFACSVWVCSTDCHLTSEEYRVSVFEDKIPRSIFGSKREEVRGRWKILRNEGFHNLYSTPNIIRVIKLTVMVLSEASASL